MYAKDKKAILYRPSTNKVVELAPINSDATPDKQAGVQPATGDSAKPAGNSEAPQSEVSSQLAPGVADNEEVAQ